ncbi:MAG: CBS domain-containing protein [Methanomassiliicoccales archaeon]
MVRKIAQTKVKEVMTREVVTVTEDMTIEQLREAFDKHDFNAFPVVRGDMVVGIVTKLDLMKAFSTGRTVSRSRVYDLWAERVGDVMRKAIISVGPEDPVQLAVDYMVEFRLHSLPVLEGRKLVGIVSRKDVLPCLIENGREVGA